ncbi:MAG TPA: tRNA 2-thiouridine(34) synthase MnmA [Clostridiaceae bacterium]|nr:tRNA 2-thiouridine(34) synthase MnmA [Clostridiaceae bacterium]
MAKSVLVAMSGGVDSSVAAALLKEQGYDCYGVMLMMHGHENTAIAAAICEQLSIPFQIIDVREQFHTQVISPFINDYVEGNTPNPCVRCNAEVKLSALLAEADRRKIALIASGHYARIKYAGSKSDQATTETTVQVNDAGWDHSSNRHLLFKAKDKQKDQSYMLYRLQQEQLGRLLLPLGKLSKEQVRDFASDRGLISATQRDSQDLCFVPDGDYASFIEREVGKRKPGNIVSSSGKILGQHRGLIHYTVGQRKGLGVAMGEPYYVLRKDAIKNEIILGAKRELYRDKILVDNINLIASPQLASPLWVATQTRYRAPEVAARIRQLSADLIEVAFAKKIIIPAPGQSVVFYLEDMVVGGGIVRDSH